MTYWDNYHVYGYNTRAIEEELYSTNNAREAKQVARAYKNDGLLAVAVWDRRTREYIYMCGDKSLFVVKSSE